MTWMSKLRVVFLEEERGVAHILVVVLVLAVLAVVGLAVYNGSKARQQYTQSATESPLSAVSPDLAPVRHRAVRRFLRTSSP